MQGPMDPFTKDSLSITVLHFKQIPDLPLASPPPRDKFIMCIPSFTAISLNADHRK